MSEIHHKGNITRYLLTMCVSSLCVRACTCTWCVHSVTPSIAAHQAPPSMEFYRQEYWSGLPFPSPWDRPDPGIKPRSLASPALAGGFFTTSATWEAHLCNTHHLQTRIMSNIQSGIMPNT